MRIVITDGRFPSFEQEMAAARACGQEIEVFQCKSADEVAAAVRGADLALVQFAPFTRAAFAGLNPGATVIRYGVGYDNLDLAAGRAGSFKLGYIPDYCTDEVADHTVALALTLLRRIAAGDRMVRDGAWAAVDVMKPLKAFSETRFGFLGLGRIGTAVARRLAPFGFQLLACDPFLPAPPAELPGLRLVDADTLLAEADAVSLHLPSSKETRHFLNAARLAAMRPHAIVVNTARGDLIDTEALAAALAAGRLRGAGLDVFEQEPVPADHPLRRAPNTLLTPHAAWYSESAMARLQGLAAEEIRRAAAGLGPRRPIPA